MSPTSSVLIIIVAERSSKTSKFLRTDCGQQLPLQTGKFLNTCEKALNLPVEAHEKVTEITVMKAEKIMMTSSDVNEK